MKNHIENIQTKQCNRMKVPETHKDIHGNGIKYQFEK